MGLWSRFSPKKLDKLENELEEFSGIQLKRRLVEVGSGNFMYCLNCGDPNKTPMILMHGYCGAGMIFYKILKTLSENYFLYIVDHLGMGRSSRPTFRAKSTYEAENFFVEALEELRKELKLKKFILAGHSLGGYISGCYCLRYPKRVLALLMLSPGGVAEKPVDSNHPSVWSSGWVNKFLLFFWLQHISLIEIMRKFGPFSGKIMKNYMRGRYELPNDEIDVIEEYLEQINLMPGSGEHAVHYILDFELWPYSPLCRRLPDLKVPIAFFYGDRDWMVADGGLKTKERSDGMVLIYTISNSDHHMYWDNPEELKTAMIDALKKMGINHSLYV
jgi:pimeloyl-ACP methyl ester carboxylesterase